MDLLCFFLSCVCYAFLRVWFICALWSPAGKGSTSLLSFMLYNCEFVTFSLVSWVRSDRFLIFAPLLTLIIFFCKTVRVYILIERVDKLSWDGITELRLCIKTFFERSEESGIFSVGLKFWLVKIPFCERSAGKSYFPPTSHVDLGSGSYIYT